MPGEVGGSEVVARRLLGALRERAPGIEWIVYAGPEALGSLAAESWAGGVRLVEAPLPSSSKPLRVLGELTWLPMRARRDRVQLLHSMGTTAPVAGGPPSVVTVLDLIYHHVPETFPRLARAGLRALVPAGARHARRVIAISESGRKDLVATLRLPPDKVDVVHLGLGMAPAPDPTPPHELRARHAIRPGPIVLSVAAGLRHKNLERLLAAFAALAPERAATLVLVGHAGLDQARLRARAAALGIADRCVFTGWIEARELEGLYRAAALFAYPSLLEGFGMPILEAMARGVPVACSSASALPEVAGGAAELFDPHDVPSISAALERLLDDPRRRDELVARGRRRASEFTWDRAAEGTLAVYERALGRGQATA